MTLAMPVRDWLERHTQHFEVLPVTCEVVREQIKMEWSHRDPSDRLIVATARVSRFAAGGRETRRSSTVTSAGRSGTDTPPRRFRLTVAYDGTLFHGWQKQEPPGEEPLRTVQGVLQAAAVSAAAAAGGGDRGEPDRCGGARAGAGRRR